MKRIKRLIKLAGLTGTVLLVSVCAAVSAQTPQTQSPTEPAQPQGQALQGNQFADLRPLNLTPDQIQMIRRINFDLKDERQAAGMKLRQAQRALAEAVESPTPNESLIGQRSREVAEAQATTIRLRSLTEARVLQVLTPDQRVKLKEIRQRNLARRLEEQQPGDGRRQQGLKRNQNNSLLSPAERRALRRQQKR